MKNLFKVKSLFHPYQLGNGKMCHSHEVNFLQLSYNFKETNLTGKRFITYKKRKIKMSEKMVTNR